MLSRPQKVTVWCALWADGIIGPYFFKIEAGHNITVNGERYRAIINDFFVPDLDDVDVDDLWFQQDGATYHTANEKDNYLKKTFGERIISRRGSMAWPPRSCDLTPLNYFLWGYVKSLVYADKPETIDALNENIPHVIAEYPNTAKSGRKLCLSAEMYHNIKLYVFEKIFFFCGM